MVEEKNITVVNDTCLPLCCYTCVNQVYVGTLNTKITCHPSSLDDEIELYQYNQWEQKSAINRILLLIYFLDIAVGGTIAEHLPIKIDRSIKLSELNQSKIYISDYMCIAQSDVDLWKKYTLFQVIGMCLVIVLIVFGISFLLPNLIAQVVLNLLALLFDVFLFLSFYRKISSIEHCLCKYIKMDLNP